MDEVAHRVEVAAAIEGGRDRQAGRDPTSAACSRRGGDSRRSPCRPSRPPGLLSTMMFWSSFRRDTRRPCAPRRRWCRRAHRARRADAVCWATAPFHSGSRRWRRHVAATTAQAVEHAEYTRAMSDPKVLFSALEPRRVALIGASSDVTKTTSRPQRFLRKHGFAGEILPVNRRAAKYWARRPTRISTRSPVRSITPTSC